MVSYLVRFAFAALLALLVVVAVYWAGLNGGFFFDDEASILYLEGVRLNVISIEAIHQAWVSGSSGPLGRPVAQLSFALNHYFSGFDPFVFKATNLAIHLACGFLVFGLAFRLLGAAKPSAMQRNILMATGALTAIWLLHPIQLLPVLHIVQRMTSLSAFFLLAALLLHVVGRERGGRAGWVMVISAWTVVWPLSFFSKESGLLFPFFALAWELIVRRSSCGSLDRFARLFSALAILVVVAGGAYAISSRAQWLWAGYDLRPFSLGERLLTEGRVLWFYLGLIVAPSMERLGLYHDDIAISTSLFSPWVTLPALIGLVGLAWLAWRVRLRSPLVSFGIAWFLIGHALESTVLPLEIAHEHRNYLPILGVLFVGAWALLQLLESKRGLGTIGVALTIAALSYFTFITGLRAHQFGEEGRRTQIESQHHRTSPRAQYQAGLTLAGLPDADLPTTTIHVLARRHYELAGEFDPNFKLGLLGLIHLNCKAGMRAAQVDIDELSRRLRETPFAPGDRNVLYSLKEMSIAGSLCLARPDVDGLFAAALANPGVSQGIQAMLHSWHADYLWLRVHDPTAARAALGAAMALAPTNASNRLKWAQLLYLAGEHEQAQKLLLELREERYSTEERKTLDELLGQLIMLDSQAHTKRVEQ
ncbi:pilus assembly protein PilF [Dechloromonas denitrificans]|uniref:Pilus assembly protein PilF n=1 Tax=Dechloromonas denitrificans TaxID=281362 RepID=A0A133XKH8_9RHOO|nr:tetratricopeptide repeat protein [Dechloromonas denitrificans]KXB31452.1 pilus assembly protein PilF [Dechloromonas denitrificans]